MIHRPKTIRARAGFTLVELLVVVLIIGILAAIAVPAVFRAIVSTQEATIKIEVDGLTQAVEAYRTKYGEYPPDGTNWNDFQRHLYVAFPNILATEVASFQRSSTNGVEFTINGADLEPAEALVLFLGGLSENSQKPFSGPGGPFVDNGTEFVYNTNRLNPLFEFDNGRLTLDKASPGDSTDEGDITYGSTADKIPVYLAKHATQPSPFVYFCSRSYTTSTGADPTVAKYSLQGDRGLAVPYLSDEVNSATPTAILFANKTSFQIMCAGMDGRFNEFGPTDAPTKSTLANKNNKWRFAQTISTKTSDPQYDNIVNFADAAKIGVAAKAKLETSN